jgi:hypothetical protein
MIHWLDKEGINALYKTKLGKDFDIEDIQEEDIVKLQHYPIEQLLRKLKNGPLSNSDVNQIYNEVFKEDLYREYICVFYILRMYFGFNVCLKDCEYYHGKIVENNWEFLTFRLEHIKNIEPFIKQFFAIDPEYNIPRARNKEARQKYIIDITLLPFNYGTLKSEPTTPPNLEASVMVVPSTVSLPFLIRW